ncbi:hypothetical protein V3C99_018455 [Haemonchus contortus]
MLYYEFLESGTTVTATSYSNQLQKVADAFLHKYLKRLETYLLHDNARPHLATMATSENSGARLGSTTSSTVLY